MKYIFRIKSKPLFSCIVTRVIYILLISCNGKDDFQQNISVTPCACADNRLIFGQPEYDTTLAKKCIDNLLSLPLNQKKTITIEEYQCIENNKDNMIRKISYIRKTKIRLIKKYLDKHIREIINKKIIALTGSNGTLNASNDLSIAGGEIIITLLNDDYFTGIYIFKIKETIFQGKTYEVIVEDRNDDFIVSTIK